MSAHSRLLVVLAAAGLTTPLPHAAPIAAAAAPAPIALADLPVLFADDTAIASQSGVVRMVHPARTRAAPVLEADRPWEGNRVYVYGSAYRDVATGEFKLWYASRPESEVGGRSDGTRGGAPSLRGHGFDVSLYATSRDGVHWEKPALGLIEFGGAKANNIIFDLHSPSVLFDMREKDPAKRYKMLGYLVRPNHGYHAAFSADGVRWHSYPKSLVLEHGDTITLTQHPVTGEYLAFHKRPVEVRGVGRRVVWLSRSADFQMWSEPELVFTPDETDDEWVRQPAERAEVYNMSVYPHAAGFIGLPSIFRVMTVRDRAQVGPGQSPVDGPLDIQLAMSADGRTWKRSWPRVNVIPRGAPGTFDGGAILGVSSTVVHAGDETFAYYTAINTGHGATMPPKRITVGRAEWRLHGFVSLDAGPAGGRIETVPLRLARPDVMINADASRGELRAALLEADGRPIAGFALEDSEVLKKDATRWKAQWRTGSAAPTDRPVRIVVTAINTRLFSVANNATK